MSFLFGYAPNTLESFPLYEFSRDGGYMELSSDNFDKSARITLFLHPFDGAHYSLEIPQGKLSDLERAAAFMLEDRIASPANDIFVSIDKPKADGLRSVYITNLTKLDVLSAHPDLDGVDWRLVSPFTLLDKGEGVSFDDCAIFDDGLRKFAIDHSLPDDLQNHILTEFLALETPKIHGIRLANSMHREPSSGTTDLEWCAERYGAIADKVLNLRQGRFSPQSVALPSWKDVQGLAAVLAVLVVGSVGLQFLELGAAREISNRIDTQISDIAQSIAPDKPAPQSPDDVKGFSQTVERVQIVDGLTMISDVYTAFGTVEGVGLEEVSFNREVGELSATVIYTEFGLDTQIKEKLDDVYKVTLGDARSRGGIVTGNLRLEAR